MWGRAFESCFFWSISLLFMHQWNNSCRPIKQQLSMWPSCPCPAFEIGIFGIRWKKSDSSFFLPVVTGILWVTPGFLLSVLRGWPGSGLAREHLSPGGKADHAWGQGPGSCCQDTRPLVILKSLLPACRFPSECVHLERVEPGARNPQPGWGRRPVHFVLY